MSAYGLQSFDTLGNPLSPRAGLWLGSATLKSINQPTGAFAPDTPTPTAPGAEFNYRVIVHVNTNGQAKLLQHVQLMWKEGTLKPDPENPDLQITDVGGRYVLIADDSLISDFVGASLRDGGNGGPPDSSTAFAFKTQYPCKVFSAPPAIRFLAVCSWTTTIRSILSCTRTIRIMTA